MPVIFISYRREDSAGHAGRLFDRLRERFGRDNVFLDVVGIDAGVDFVETIDRAVGSCDVLLAVIGREWLTCQDKQKRRRLDDPNDFIRVEISAALKRNVRVVPVLVEGAEMPPTGELPAELQGLTRRQAVELRDSRWDADVEALMAALERDAARPGEAPVRPAPPPAGSGSAAPQRERKPRRRALVWGMGALIAVALLVAAERGVSFWRDRQAAEARREAGPTTTTEPESKTVEVPDLVGLSLQAAIDRLREAGLVAANQEARPTDQAPAGEVLSQWPRAGIHLGLGSAVDLVYAQPPPDTRLTVPDVTGTPYGEALRALQEAGFVVSRRTEPSRAEPSTVLRQQPQAGERVERGARITVTYAVPIVTGIEVPAVVGMEIREAMTAVQAAGLGFTRRSEPSSAARFTVVRQEPPAGRQVEKGTKVTLVYAVSIDDRPPERVDRTTVSIWYNDETERPAAEDLASHLRGLRLPKTEFKISPARQPLPVGKLFYPSRSEAELASTIARRSGDFLWKLSGRRVIIQMNLDPEVTRGGGWILTLPKL